MAARSRQQLSIGRRAVAAERLSVIFVPGGARLYSRVDHVSTRSNQRRSNAGGQQVGVAAVALDVVVE